MNSRSALPRTRNKAAFEAHLAQDTRGELRSWTFVGRLGFVTTHSIADFDRFKRDFDEVSSSSAKMLLSATISPHVIPQHDGALG
jgi:hypothetical protein